MSDEPAVATGRKVPVARIVMTRAEGPSAECGRTYYEKRFADANALLRIWSNTAPAAGGYDKCDIEIHWKNGVVHRHRYDLVHHSLGIPDLGADVAATLMFYSGRRCPVGKREQDYARFLQQDWVVKLKPVCERILDECALFDFDDYQHQTELERQRVERLRDPAATGAPLTDAVGSAETRATSTVLTPLPPEVEADPWSEPLRRQPRAPKMAAR